MENNNLDQFLKKIEVIKDTLESIYKLRALITKRVEGVFVLINEFKNRPQKIKDEVTFSEDQLLLFNTNNINLDEKFEITKNIDELNKEIEALLKNKSKFEVEDIIDTVIKNAREILTNSKNLYESLKYYQPIIAKFNKNIDKINDMDYNNLLTFSNTLKSICEIINKDLNLVKLMH